MESFRGTLARGGKNTSFFQMQLRDEANPCLISREFRGLRSATKDALLGTCDLSRKVDQSFSADKVKLKFMRASG